MTEPDRGNGIPGAPTRSGIPRRFEPSSDAQPGPVLTEVGEREVREQRKKAIQGRATLGHLVAVRRAKLGLTQADLAVRMGVSQAAVARIEEGHPPSTDALRQLAKVFPPEEGNDELLHWVERELHWRSPQFRRQGARARRESLDLRWGFLDGRRWLWAGLAFAGLSAVLVAAVVIVAGQSSDDGGSVPEPAELVSATPPPAPVPVEAKPKKASSSADKSEKADESPAPGTDGDESSSEGETTSSDDESSGPPSGNAGMRQPPRTTPVSTPAPPPPAPVNDRRPGILHGLDLGP